MTDCIFPLQPENVDVFGCQFVCSAQRGLRAGDRPHTVHTLQSSAENAETCQDRACPNRWGRSRNPRGKTVHVNWVVGLLGPSNANRKRVWMERNAKGGLFKPRTVKELVPKGIGASSVQGFGDHRMTRDHSLINNSEVLYQSPLPIRFLYPQNWGVTWAVSFF